MLLIGTTGREGEKPEAGRLGTRKLIWKPEVVAAKLCRPSVRSGRLSGGAPKAGSFPWRMRPKQSRAGEEESYASSQKAAVASIHHGRSRSRRRPIHTIPPVTVNPRRRLKERLLVRKRKKVGVRLSLSPPSHPRIGTSDILPSRPRDANAMAFIILAYSLKFSVTGSGDKQCVMDHQLE